MGSDKTVFQYARKNFNWLVSMQDINSLRRKFRLMDGRHDVVRVEDLLSGRWMLRLCQPDVMNFAFFVPYTVWYLVDMYSGLLLADASHLLNCSRSTLWHAMTVDDSGLGRSIFHALSPNETGTSCAARLTP